MKAYYIYAYSKRDSKRYDFDINLLSIHCEPIEIIRVSNEESLWFHAHVLDARGMTFSTEEVIIRKERI